MGLFSTTALRSTTEFPLNDLMGMQVCRTSPYTRSTSNPNPGPKQDRPNWFSNLGQPFAATEHHCDGQRPRWVDFSRMMTGSNICPTVVQEN